MTCPRSKHFHAICNDVFEKENFEKVIEVVDANSALELVVIEFPNTWESSIEIRDDATRNDHKYRLLDFWRTPLA